MNKDKSCAGKTKPGDLKPLDMSAAAVAKRKAVNDKLFNFIHQIEANNESKDKARK